MRWLAIVLVVVGAAGLLGSASASPSQAIPTPTGPHPASVYKVTNLDVAPVTVRHVITSDAGVLTYEFADTLAVGQVKEYHLSQMDAVVSPFSGVLDLWVDQYTNDPPIAAEISGFDYIRHHQYLTPIIKK